MSSVVVTKCSSDVVTPSEPATAMASGDIHLSWFDKAAGSTAVSALLVFDKPIVDPVATIRRALSRALVHYYPISGRLAAGADGGCSEVINTTCGGGGAGAGVQFVGASASSALGADVLRPALLNDLLLHYPEQFVCGHQDPLLLMQVTEFSCGGFVVGVTWNHAVADGAGIGQLLQAVGELARGMSLSSMVPVRRDESVLAARPQGGMTAGDLCAAAGYYGNCLIMESVEASNAEVAKGEIKDVVELIRTAKRNISKSLALDPAPAAPPRARARVGYNTLIVLSWRNLGLEVPDFGGGTPSGVYY